MICSECKKNPAILFYEKIDNGKNTMEGLCYDCAKKKGINPMEVLSKQQDLLSKDKINLNDMNKQLESIFKDLAENLDINNLDNIEGAITFGNIEDENGDEYDDEEKPRFAGAAIPLGSIFSNMVHPKNDDESKEEAQSESKKTIKVEKKRNQKQNKKIFGHIWN